ncbi:MAG: glycosyltransferase, partial [Rikenellaceae bacterium]
MVSIIVCSINPELAESFRENVLATIGVECEFIIFDNRGTGLGICEVYNRCAEQAKYDYLLFAHEDILFGTQNWGAIIIEKLSDPTTGAIGFAGCTVKSKRYSGWCQMHCFVKENL